MGWTQGSWAATRRRSPRPTPGRCCGQRYSCGVYGHIHSRIDLIRPIRSIRSVSSSCIGVHSGIGWVWGGAESACGSTRPDGWAESESEAWFRFRFRRHVRGDTFGWLVAEFPSVLLLCLCLCLYLLRVHTTVCMTIAGGSWVRCVWAGAGAVEPPVAVGCRTRALSSRRCLRATRRRQRGV